MLCALPFAISLRLTFMTSDPVLSNFSLTLVASMHFRLPSRMHNEVSSAKPKEALPSDCVKLLRAKKPSSSLSLQRRCQQLTGTPMV